jgi:hypothetical protein
VAVKSSKVNKLLKMGNKLFQSFCIDTLKSPEIIAAAAVAIGLKMMLSMSIIRWSKTTKYAEETSNHAKSHSKMPFNSFIARQKFR